ncbi:histidinol-phosphate aminotransferase [Beutenbergia cavernae DSM 12333]|uniref:Aromatic amino acid aminotransferase n=1 Tax=Beutenbergia cavernae (strain ATCC BAA-8 / DSM 12333 / CCUG 43141 / JCM 11478 / NBRC 16432 / NCIMB 13614 / HKI 0122) TaxID=471853 RepID=C5C570_BEUC1|nr:histidinol-phosphate transaminase [Beutenbergia cavernae]ACQ82210.1 histidinol-phosphate aminotransferase [Beutenbergia cavernae DSM 12333]
MPSQDRVALREAITSLPAYVPGARGGVGRFSYKLSSNENPFPPLPGVLAAVADAAADLNRYPDMYAGELVEAIAALHGVKPGRVVVGNGSVAVLEFVLDAVCETGDEVVYPWRSFEAYPIVVSVAGASGVPVPLLPDGRHDLDAMLAAVTDRTRAVLLCSPNNPTGPALAGDDIRSFLAAVPSHVLVLLDEAYTEFVRDPRAIDGVPLVDDAPNVVVLRTFSKAYGLAGLRVGYAVARTRLADGFRAASTPFGVNALAQVAALESLRERPALLARVDELVAERDRVTSALAAHGWDLPDAQGNFVWFGLGERTSAFAKACVEEGVIVRPFGAEGARVTIGEREANDVVIDVARRFLS